jgi:DNA polymerase I
MSDETGVPTRKLVLIDGYSLLFRAFFSGRPLSTTDGRPTGALFGLSQMLFTLLNQEKPDAIIMCWDAHAQTHRSIAYSEYKAHRPEAPSDLKEQMVGARELVKAFGIHAAEVDGYEADDLIGTFATKGNREGWNVVIVTGDSDQLQLVGGNVIVQMTQRGVTEVKIYDTAAVMERYGIPPERIPDYKALVGDTSDNIPGVPGIGDKTATALLQKWGDLDNLLAHVAEVTPPKARTALEANIEQAKFSRELATIHCEVPGDLEIVPYTPSAEGWANLRELFARLEFRSLMGRIPREESKSPLEELEAGTPAEVFAAEITRIENQAQWEQALAAAQQSGTAAIMLELDSPSAMRANINGVAFAPSAAQGYYVPFRLEAKAEPGGLDNLFAEEDKPADGFAIGKEELAALCESAIISKIGHNVKPFEIVMERMGLTPTPFAFDSMIAAYVLNAGRSGYPLMDLCESYLGQRLEADDAYQPGENLAREAAAVFALQEPLRKEIADKEMTDVLDKLEMPLVPVLAQIEQAGLLIDVPYLNTLGNRMGQQIDALAQEIYALAGEEFNIGSPKQLQVILFEKMNLPTGKKTKTGYSTGADLLEQLAGEYEIARKIIDYREVAKLKATYADALVKLLNPQTQRVHTSLNQTVASTGRLSSSEPNLQNIPVRSEIGREIRRAFVAPQGKVLLSCDYSQIELRLLAHITKDATLVQAFQNDEDIHAATASRVFDIPLEQVTPDQRRQAKTINFAVIYGQSAFALAATLGVSSATASEWIKEYFNRLPGVKQYVEETTALAHRQKYVRTLMGRRRYVPELDSGNHNLRQFGERAAVNMPIQGTAADIMKLAMRSVYDYLRNECAGGCVMLLQVHDELLFEVDESQLAEIVAPIRARMESAFPIDVPLRADAKAGTNWAEMTAAH